ncbi:Myb-like DNA-binding domain-containing protein [Bacillus sp. DTU_2020_1000418_1_SI_GHA_SEK_038]|uniref:Myb-like DNA-binding domain-containing protein n=1 Tax=Bacillus sp. DTU_2020_1000418_1_SI_GHA_SEK_038 TaxID=3077585 RepID=UPI0028E2B6A2|nr:Myb-like DNA-binding domain-containing protein [Bacillus sp. DTU_2020_1000418_1_SI_GHA_SEK_038]WNS74413.1 Myb-like DNA-binding domain-containing protein [Bacillus sp. DTU_2020_1000418_1_SI_GHA_SEK_038]
MKARKGLWTEEEDHLLMEIVEEYVSNGDSRASAFKKASIELGRSEAACKSRWNSVLKDKAEKSIKAPKEPFENKELESSQIHLPEKNEPINSLDQAISFLKNYSAELPEAELIDENNRLQEDNNRLNAKNKSLMKTLVEKQELFEMEREKYENVLKILQQADCLLKKEPIRMIH